MIQSLLIMWTGFIIIYALEHGGDDKHIAKSLVLLMLTISVLLSLGFYAAIHFIIAGIIIHWCTYEIFKNLFSGIDDWWRMSGNTIVDKWGRRHPQITFIMKFISFILLIVFETWNTLKVIFL